MTVAALAEVGFFITSCPACNRQVLTHLVAFDQDGREIRRCVHCDGETSRDGKLVSAEELQQHGYRLVDTGGCVNGNGCGLGCGTRRQD